MCQDLIRHNVSSRIDNKFFIAGHTYASIDQTFERYTSKIRTRAVVQAVLVVE